MKFYFIVYGFIIISFILYTSLKIKIVCDEETQKMIDNKQSIIYAFWHGEQFLMTRYLRNKNVHIMVSLSKDGDLQTGILERLGFHCIRGSSSKGGRAAVKKIIDIFKQKDNPSLAIAVDGPRGPIYEPKMGVFFIAAKLKIPVIPVKIDYYNSITFPKTWDLYTVPLPFSKVTIKLGKPLLFDNIRAGEENKKKFLEEADKLKYS
ncbi:MAG: lysophospholipid acyltransferase family protein [Candidatus Muiribacteriota bacterium]